MRTRAIVIATGARYRKLELPTLPRFEGAGVYYSATHLEAQLCEGEEVVVVGGGNSAGQAAVFLSQLATHVHVLVRGPGLADSMSRYLIQRIEGTPNITLRTRTEIVRARGRRPPGAASPGATSTRGQPRPAPIRNVFSMTGADPNTALAGRLRRARRQGLRQDRRRPDAPTSSTRDRLAAARAAPT